MDENKLNNDINNIDNIDNNKNIIKIITLPPKIQKYILNILKSIILYKELEDYNDFYKFRRICCNYGLVNWYWFNYFCQVASDNVILDFNDSEIDYENENENKFKLISYSTLKYGVLQFKDIDRESIDFINRFSTSLESIKIQETGDNWIGDSINNLTHLNKLNNLNRIEINFQITINCFGPKLVRLNSTEQEEFKFKTCELRINMDFLISQYYSYDFIYSLIKDLKPRLLYINCDSTTDYGSTHFLHYHSISKLNQHYENVQITGDYISLYPLYRFLKSPNLKSFTFSLQFRYLLSIYNNSNNNSLDNISENINQQYKKIKIIHNNDINNNNNDNSQVQQSYNFEEMDNEDNIDYVNEDYYGYCIYSRSGDTNTSIPKYSRSLWNECMRLLTNNTTITKLVINSETCQCSGTRCGWNEILDINFLIDFINIFKNNKTIKSLNLPIIKEFINFKIELSELLSSMLDQNTTLEFLELNYIDYELSQKDYYLNISTSNSKCIINHNSINNKNIINL